MAVECRGAAAGGAGSYKVAASSAWWPAEPSVIAGNGLGSHALLLAAGET